MENLITKESIYLDPEKYTLTLYNCKLKNNLKSATEIYNRTNKIRFQMNRIKEVLKDKGISQTWLAKQM